jgi:uncharacterized membrane protein
MSTPGVALLVFSIGIFSGFRAFTPLALICWFTVLGKLPTFPGWMAFAGSWISVALLTAAALFELVADKRPTTPSRLQQPAISFRMALGALCGSLLAQSDGFSTLFGAMIGCAGAFSGAYLGYYTRKRTEIRFHLRDFPVALIEDAITIGGAALLASAL